VTMAGRSHTQPHPASSVKVKEVVELCLHCTLWGEKFSFREAFVNREKQVLA